LVAFFLIHDKIKNNISPHLFEISPYDFLGCIEDGWGQISLRYIFLAACQIPVKIPVKVQKCGFLTIPTVKHFKIFFTGAVFYGESRGGVQFQYYSSKGVILQVHGRIMWCVASGRVFDSD